MVTNGVHRCKIVVQKEAGETWPVNLRVAEDGAGFGLCHRRGTDAQTERDFKMIRCKGQGVETINSYRFWIRSGSLLRTMSRMFPLIWVG